MQQSSRPVTSNQPGLHPRLADRVLRHLRHPSRRPVPDFSRAAFAELASLQAEDPRPLVLDSFCGTGMSTALLARRHPGHRVVGIDRSADRLGRHESSRAGDVADSGPGSYLLLRAECEDIWQLLREAGWQVDCHYLLYPNPWPKAAHLQRRVHGHPGFADLVALGGRIELRSNWQTYVEEFGVALLLAGIPGRVCRLPEEPPLTRFEAKYRASGHDLWQYSGGDGPT